MGMEEGIEQTGLWQTDICSEAFPGPILLSIPELICTANLNAKPANKVFPLND